MTWWESINYRPLSESQLLVLSPTPNIGPARALQTKTDPGYSAFRTISLGVSGAHYIVIAGGSIVGFLGGASAKINMNTVSPGS